MYPVHCHIFYVYKHTCMFPFVVMSVSTVTPAHAYLYIDNTVMPQVLIQSLQHLSIFPELYNPGNTCPFSPYLYNVNSCQFSPPLQFTIMVNVTSVYFPLPLQSW